MKLIFFFFKKKIVPYKQEPTRTCRGHLISPSPTISFPSHESLHSLYCFPTSFLWTDQPTNLSIIICPSLQPSLLMSPYQPLLGNSIAQLCCASSQVGPTCGMEEAASTSVFPASSSLHSFSLLATPTSSLSHASFSILHSPTYFFISLHLEVYLLFVSFIPHFFSKRGPKWLTLFSTFSL